MTGIEQMSVLTCLGVFSSAFFEPGLSNLGRCKNPSFRRAYLKDAKKHGIDEGPELFALALQVLVNRSLAHLSVF
jgi:hypothetical protein